MAAYRVNFTSCPYCKEELVHILRTVLECEVRGQPLPETAKLEFETVHCNYQAIQHAIYH
jgi:hypothetical protein